MEWFEAVLLGVVQGLTEFLPISSSGHLVIFQKLIGLPEHNLMFDIAAHWGTVAAVLTVYYRVLLKTAVQFIKNPRFNSSMESRLVWLTILASVPTALIGLSLKDLFESLFSQPKAVGSFMILTGAFLFWTKRYPSSKASPGFDRLENLDSLNWWKALLVGTAQAFAIAPGVSRSGSTIATGILLGVEHRAAALFSFVLSIPAILGAGVLQLRDVGAWDMEALKAMGVGFFVAYLAGLVGLLGILHFVKKGRLELFSFYLWVVGPLCIWWG